MTSIKLRHVLTAAAVVFVPVYVLLRLLTTRGHGMPANNWLALGVLLLVAALVALGGWSIRTYLKGEARTPLDPRRARRTVVSAQASALGGGALVGWYLAQAAIHVRRLDVERSRSALLLTLALAGGSALLSGVGLLVQSWCRIDDDDDPDNPQGPTPTPSV